jgi:hypothetical protein
MAFTALPICLHRNSARCILDRRHDIVQLWGRENCLVPAGNRTVIH